jgi:hypothetical protein
MYLPARPLALVRAGDSNRAQKMGDELQTPNHNSWTLVIPSNVLTVVGCCVGRLAAPV